MTKRKMTTGQTMNYYTENKRLINKTPTNTVSEARRSERVAVQTGQTMTYKTLHRLFYFLCSVL
jgi:hypothetical protein